MEGTIKPTLKSQECPPYMHRRIWTNNEHIRVCSLQHSNEWSLREGDKHGGCLYPKVKRMTMEGFRKPLVKKMKMEVFPKTTLEKIKMVVEKNTQLQEIAGNILKRTHTQVHKNSATADAKHPWYDFATLGQNHVAQKTTAHAFTPLKPWKI